MINVSSVGYKLRNSVLFNSLAPTVGNSDGPLPGLSAVLTTLPFEIIRKKNNQKLKKAKADRLFQIISVCVLAAPAQCSC